MAANEFVVGTPIQITVTFTNEVTGALTDPSSVTGGIQLGVETPIYFALSDMVQVSTGIWYYIFVTTSLAPGFYMVQVQSAGAINGITDPAVFTLLAPSISGLT
jgi:hypothetical protein